MVTTPEIFIFCLAICEIVVTCNGIGLGLFGLGLFEQGYNVACPVLYKAGCETSRGEDRGIYDGSTAFLGGTGGFLTGLVAGVNCATLASGIIGGDKKKGQCNLTKAQCCKNTGVQCGNNVFQETYYKGYSLACPSGYEFGSGDYAKGVFGESTAALGAYLGAFMCGVQGLKACFLTSGAIGGRNAAPGSGKQAQKGEPDDRSLGLFREGYDAACPITYRAGCETAKGEGKGIYDGSTIVVGGTAGYLTGIVAGINCGLLASGAIGNGSETYVNGKKAQCMCKLTKAQCCKTTKVQCGDNSFQESYNGGYSIGCQAGYEFSTGEYAKGLFDEATGAAGAYIAGIMCGFQGYETCLLTSSGIGVFESLLKVL